MRDLEEDTCVEFENIDAFMKEYLVDIKDKGRDVNFSKVKSPPEKYPDYI